MFDDSHVSMNKTGHFSYIAYFLSKKNKKRPRLARKRVGTLPVSAINYELKKNSDFVDPSYSLGQRSEFDVK
jgi:hypothetical protein